MTRCIIGIMNSVTSKTNTWYAIKRPNPKARRRSFSISQRKRNKEGKVTQTKLQFDALDTINEQLRRGVLDLTEAEQKSQELVDQLYKSLAPYNPIKNHENLKILEDYWTHEYEDRDLVAPGVAKAELRSAVAALGEVSLITGTAKDYHAALKKAGFKGRKQARMVSKLTQILRYLKRTDVKIRKDRKELIKPKFLTEAEMLRVAESIKTPLISLAVKAAFYTGCRFGELLALEPHDVTEKAVRVDKQIDRYGETRLPKNHKPRVSYLIREGFNAVSEWAAIPIEQRKALRDLKVAEIFKKHCVVTLKNPMKECVFHDLRHSYAVYMVHKGVGITMVAKSMGNGVGVCSEYYAGFTLSDEGIEAIDRILG